MEKGRREKLGELFFDYAKGAFNVLFLGAFVLYFSKEGELTVMDVLPMIVIGGGIVIVFTILGYKLMPKDGKITLTIKG
jgi:hypothetical protein